MSDKEFFGGECYDKRNISSENNRTLIIRNMSYDELIGNESLKSELKKFGIIDVSKVSKNQLPHLRPVKVYCKDTLTRNDLLNSNIVIETDTIRRILYIVPNCKPPKICDKCKSYEHATSNCKSKSLCGFCSSEEHVDENCTAEDDDVECPNCSQAHDAYSRICPAYKKARNQLETEALQLINNRAILKPKTNEQPNNNDFYRVDSLTTDVSTIQKELKIIKDSNGTREDRILTALENSTNALESNKQAIENIMGKVRTMVDDSCQILHKTIQNENVQLENKIYQYIRSNCVQKNPDNKISKNTPSALTSDGKASLTF
jgi:hypothetical protein